MKSKVVARRELLAQARVNLKNKDTPKNRAKVQKKKAALVKARSKLKARKARVVSARKILKDKIVKLRDFRAERRQSVLL